MRLTRDHKVKLTIGEESVTFALRHPTNQELNEFMADRYEVGRKGKMNDRSTEARCAFFDRLLTGVENLEDVDGAAIGPDRKELIPINWKSQVVYQVFEDVEIDEKN